jgi:hypothetical protein
VRTGKLTIRGTVQKSWQKIYETTLVAADSYTKLLIHGDSIGDATGKTVTAHNQAAVTTAQYKFTQVGSSIVFDGTTDWLSLDDSADWDWGSSNWTFDCWIKTSSSANRYIITRGEGWYSFAICVDGTGGSVYVASFQPTSHTQNFIIYGTTSISDGAWHHLAVVRNGSAQYLFIDGIKQGTDGSFSGTIEADNLGFTIAGGTAGGYSLNGYLAEIRISVGIARWTSNFTPPTTPYDGAVTSLHLTGLDGDTDIEYKLVTRFISGTASNAYSFRLNNDSGANYGFQRVVGESSTSSASQYTGQTALYIDESTNALNDVSYSELLIHARSGYVHPIERLLAGGINSTTVTTLRIMGAVWSNTASNLTSLDIAAAVTNGIAVGSYIALYRRRL